jgi:hypothetical protein
MNCIDMPRKQINFKIDDRLIPAFKDAAQEAGMSINGYLETLLMGHLKNLGKVPMDVQPLPEARGGKRSGAGKPKASPPANTTMSPEELEAAAQSLGEAFTGSILGLEEVERPMGDRSGGEGDIEN